MHQDQDASRPTPSRGSLANRRDFFKKASSVALGGAAMLAPLTAGVMVVLDPLGRKVEKSGFVRVTSLPSVPEDGLPRKFVVISSYADAWNRNPALPVGAVYLRRTGAKAVQALNAVCPHAGCFVDFVGARKTFHCPCHNSAFALDGRISDPKSPSPRGLDELEVEIRNETEVWVKFQNYLAGHEKKIPVA